MTRVEDWIEYANFDDHVFLAKHKDNSGWRAVKKIVNMEIDDKGNRWIHKEVNMLLALSATPCDRLVLMQCLAHDTPEVNKSTLIFDYYPAGDVRHWRKQNFENKNDKMVPESHIWRFFIQVTCILQNRERNSRLTRIQMAQALAFLHGVIGPYNGAGIIHRDIKPKNILVFYNGSSTYPSFKLHDFGCGTFYSPNKERNDAYCGTFDYQPPETPRINTFAADIWAIGGCVHYLCLNMPPTKDLAEFRKTRKLPSNWDKHYHDEEQWYRANVARHVTPVNLTPGEQIAKNVDTKSSKGFNHQYSDTLNHWLRKACHKQVHHRATHAELLRVMIPVARDMLHELTGGGGLADLACFGD